MKFIAGFLLGTSGASMIFLALYCTGDAFTVLMAVGVVILGDGVFQLIMEIIEGW